MASLTVLEGIVDEQMRERLGNEDGGPRPPAPAGAARSGAGLFLGRSALAHRQHDPNTTIAKQSAKHMKQAK